MKLYVIKRDDGLYWNNDLKTYVSDIFKATHYMSPNCYFASTDIRSWTPIIIKEGDDTEAVEALKKVRDLYNEHLYCSYHEGKYPYHTYTSEKNLIKEINELIKEYEGKNE